MKQLRRIYTGAGVSLILALAAGFTAPISADTVMLKSGVVEDNVKTIITRTSVLTEFEDGRHVEHAKSEVRTVRIRPIEWKKVKAVSAEEEQKFREAEERRIAQATAEGDTWEARPEDQKISPWGNFGLGLIPGYSGLYRTEKTGAAIAMSIFSGLAFANAVDVAKAKKETNTAGFVSMYMLFNMTGSGGSSGPSPQMLFIELSSFSSISKEHTLKGGLTGRTLVSPGATPAIQRHTDATVQATAGLLLLAALASNSISSYLSADSWNEGSYTGQKGEPPTTTGSRMVRSLVFPGWGQIYAGNRTKGWVFAGVGLGLLAYELSREQNAIRAIKRYEDTSNSFPNAIILPNIFVRDPVASVQLQQKMIPMLLMKQMHVRNDVKKAMADRGHAFAALAGFWAYNVVDSAFWTGREKKTVSLVPDLAYLPGSVFGSPTESRFELRGGLRLSILLSEVEP